MREPGVAPSAASRDGLPHSGSRGFATSHWEPVELRQVHSKAGGAGSGAARGGSGGADHRPPPARPGIPTPDLHPAAGGGCPGRRRNHAGRRGGAGHAVSRCHAGFGHRLRERHARHRRLSVRGPDGAHQRRRRRLRQRRRRRPVHRARRHRPQPPVPQRRWPAIHRGGRGGRARLHPPAVRQLPPRRADLRRHRRRRRTSTCSSAACRATRPGCTATTPTARSRT